MIDYQEIFEHALDSMLQRYEAGQLRFLDESCLRGALFFICLDLINARDLTPVLIEPNTTIIQGTNLKADLVLGQKEVVIELKFEPRYPRLLGWKKKMPVVSWQEVEKDIERLAKYVKDGVTYAHFIMIDEDGRWKSKTIEGGWRRIKLPNWKAYLARVTHSASTSTLTSEKLEI